MKHRLTDNHKESQHHSVWRLRLDLPGHSALPQLHLYWQRVMNVSIASWSETSVHALENKRITEPQFCLQHSKIKWMLCTLIHKQSMNQKEFDVGRKQEKVNSTYRCWKTYWSVFRQWHCHFGKKRYILVHDYARAHCTMTVNSSVGNGSMMETIHLLFSPDHLSG